MSEKSDKEYEKKNLRTKDCYNRVGALTVP
jgi:hypothetical protein